MFEQKPGETAQDWYKRLKDIRAQLEPKFRIAKDKASQEINEKAAEKARMRAALEEVDQ